MYFKVLKDFKPQQRYISVNPFFLGGGVQSCGKIFCQPGKCEKKRLLFYESAQTSSDFTRVPVWEKLRNWVFATNSDFLIPISLQPTVADLRNLEEWIMLSDNLSLKYLRFTPLGCKDIEIIKIKFVAKT